MMRAEELISNREIKFRAWDERSGEMYEDVQNCMFDWFLASMIVMQYTGLRDKNGKKIYEGDILSGNRQVKFGEYFGPFGMGTGFYTVCFRGEYENAKVFEGQAFGITIRQVGKSEIIGNIFKNPELLTSDLK